MRFLNEIDQVDIYRGYLPHWRQRRVIYFVTFRLYDSLPATKLTLLRQERQLWLKLNPAPRSLAQLEEYNLRFNLRVQEWLDAGVGSCVLEDPRLKESMDQILKFFNGRRYDLDEFCTMPNHVHALVCPRPRWTLQRIVHSWKSFSAKQINQVLGRTGRLWHREYFDHIVRHEMQLERVRDYIKRNPELWRK
jgi:REP element-mobilizing transposase RayT